MNHSRLGAFAYTCRFPNFEYDGFAHMAAAAELDIGGHPVDAWNALTTASLFLERRLGQVPAAVRNAARTIANRPGWEPIASALGSMEPEDD